MQRNQRAGTQKYTDIEAKSFGTGRSTPVPPSKTSELDEMYPGFRCVSSGKARKNGLNSYPEFQIVPHMSP
jgi:hypothetical protein